MLRCLFNWGWFISLREGAIRAGMFPFNLQFPTIISVSDVSLGLIWILSRVRNVYAGFFLTSHTYSISFIFVFHIKSDPFDRELHSWKLLGF